MVQVAATEPGHCCCKHQGTISSSPSYGSAAEHHCSPAKLRGPPTDLAPAVHPATAAAENAPTQPSHRLQGVACLADRHHAAVAACAAGHSGGPTGLPSAQTQTCTMAGGGLAGKRGQQSTGDEVAQCRESAAGSAGCVATGNTSNSNRTRSSEGGSAVRASVKRPGHRATAAAASSPKPLAAGWEPTGMAHPCAQTPAQHREVLLQAGGGRASAGRAPNQSEAGKASLIHPQTSQLALNPSLPLHAPTFPSPTSLKSSNSANRASHPLSCT